MVVMGARVHKRKQGFTLMEVLMATFVSSLIMAGILSAHLSALGAADMSSAWADADSQANRALEKMIRGVGGLPALRSFHAHAISLTSTSAGWTLTDGFTGEGYIYSSSSQTISTGAGEVVVGNVSESSVTFSGSVITLSIEVVKPSRSLRPSSGYTTTVQVRNG